MEFKAIVVLQVLLDLVLAALIVWCLWRRDSSRDVGSPPRLSKDQVEMEAQRWKDTSEELAGLLRSRLEELEGLTGELDRAEIRAAETLQRMERMEANWISTREFYGRALGCLREGMSPEDVARRTGFGLDELRLIQRLSLTGRRAG